MSEHFTPFLCKHHLLLPRSSPQNLLSQFEQSLVQPRDLRMTSDSTEMRVNVNHACTSHGKTVFEEQCNRNRYISASSIDPSTIGHFDQSALPEALRFLQDGLQRAFNYKTFLLVSYIISVLTEVRFVEMVYRSSMIGAASC